MKIIGRTKAQESLRQYYESGRPEFVVIYGRRRVGKTFLVREYFAQRFTFYFTGTIGENADAGSQLRNFDAAIVEYGGQMESPSQDWHAAFRKLRKLVERHPAGERAVLFIDELPWLDTPGSDFLPALDYFWNNFASARPEVLLIGCGSATSWIVTNLFANRGGLHNRLTGRIHLSPFTLGESEEFLSELGVVMNRLQILESYMIFGGIPYYLNMFHKGLGPSQNTDELLFTEHAPLREEYAELYRSLFRNPERHMKIIATLTRRLAGMTRDEIIARSGIPGGGNLTRTLDELEQCGFISKFSDFTRPKNGAYYRIADMFSLFYWRFVHNNNSKDAYFWTNLLDHGARLAWRGFAFEQVCLLHIAQIKTRLGISGISTNSAAWRSRESSPGAQIDLLIDRRDGVINLCEMKFSEHPFTIDKNTDEALQRKRLVFSAETGTKKALHLTMVTTCGLSPKGYRAAVQSEVTMDDLFL